MKTIYYNHITISKESNIDYVPMAHSTLNEKHNVMQSDRPNPKEYPIVSYYGIGRGGHRQLSNKGNIGKAEHGVTDAAFFEQIPFAAKCLTDNEDFDAATRGNYAMRTIKEINGKRYALYWLKKLSLGSGNIVTETITVDPNGVDSVANYTPTASQLDPQPTFLEPGKVIPSTGVKITTRMAVQEVLNAQDLKMIMEASELIYGNTSFAQISEIGIVAAIPRTNNGEGNGGGNITYTEVSTATVCSFIKGTHSIDETSRALDIKIELSDTNNRNF